MLWLRPAPQHHIRSPQRTYNVFNESTAHDPIKVWSIALPAVDAASSTNHSTWRAALEPAPDHDDPPPGAVSLTPVKFLTWRSKDGSAVPAGGAITEVHVKSVYKPGITIMYARSAEDFSLPAGIPDVVLQQLKPLRKPEWLNRSILVIGPRFPVEWGKDIIASEFKYGIERMVRAGQLDASSPFISSVLNVLETIGSTGSAGAPVPDTTLRMAKRPAEADIAAAIALSLR